MRRLLFVKQGNSVWISHLDLMRLFQRAFKRAGLPLTHTKGFNPRPSVSIALPLSVSVESQCELLDFELEDMDVANEEIRSRLNKALVSGIEVLQVYEANRKINEIAYLKCQIRMEYDRGVPECAASKISELFRTDEVIVPKKSKNGIVDQNIIPMIQSISVEMIDDTSINLQADICCQNPSLNPAQLVAAIEHYLPDLKPDFSRCRRLEIFDRDHNVFR